MNSEIGWVYIMRNASMPGLVKIGFTMDDPWERANQLSSSTSVPGPFEVLFSIKTRYPLEVESEAHRNLAFCRVSSAREFFQVNKKLLLFKDPRDDKEYWHSEQEIIEYCILKIRESARLIPIKKQIETAEKEYRQMEIRCGYLQRQLEWNQMMKAGVPPNEASSTIPN